MNGVTHPVGPPSVFVMFGRYTICVAVPLVSHVAAAATLGRASGSSVITRMAARNGTARPVRRRDLFKTVNKLDHGQGPCGGLAFLDRSRESPLLRGPTAVEHSPIGDIAPAPNQITANVRGGRWEAFRSSQLADALPTNTEPAGHLGTAE